MTRRRGGESFQTDTGTVLLRRDPDAANTWVLELDGHRQSHVDLDDPTHLGFDYMRRIGHVVDAFALPGAPIDAVHLGGGGLTLPRYIATTRPGSHQRVFEIDAALIELVRRELPLRPQWHIRVGATDALQGLTSLRAGSTDVVICDVFADGRIPAHLSSEALALQASRVLRAGGIYMVNVVDMPPLDSARAHITAVESSFAQVTAIVQVSRLKSSRHGNVVVVGSARQLPTAALARQVARDRNPGRVLTGPALRRLR